MPARILIVDDDLATREGLALAIGAAGYHTLTVGNIPAAQDLIDAAPPDLLITEVRVGGSNGLQLLAMAACPLSAIVVTGSPDAAVEADARALGADFMLKPVALPALLGRIAGKLRAATPAPFVVGRRWVRRRLARPVPLRVNHEYFAKIIEVSDRGVGLEVHWRQASPLPSSVALDIDTESDVSVPVNLAWARRQGDEVWLCGGTIDDNALPRWRGLLDGFA